MGCIEALEKPRSDVSPGLPVVLVVAAALVDKDGRVLLGKRPGNKAMAGLWEFPGGKVQDGETPEFALARELEEELGIDSRECCFSPLAFASHSYDDFHLLMPLYVCRMWKGTPQPLEHQALKWAHPKDMYDYAMPQADVPLIDKLQQFL